jgi:hypothetical protein
MNRKITLLRVRKELFDEGALAFSDTGLQRAMFDEVDDHGRLPVYG